MKEVAKAATVGAMAFGVYFSTLAPGLVAEPDAPAFALAGAVLGVPHNPGYPVYVTIGHVFSWLPIGTPAYEMNLLSALFGAIAVGVWFLVMRRLGARTVVAGATALAGGLGPLFWSSSVVAEVYTMEAALVGGMLLGLLAWSQTKSATAYYASVACLALSLAHHTTDVLLAPAMALFVLATDARWALQRRRLFWTLAILAMGLLPYGLILVRTWQHAPMLESPARNLKELLAVISARQFADGVFAFSLHDVMFDRAPQMLRALARELTPVGAVAAVAGGLLLARRRSPAAWLALLGPVGFVAFSANYDVIDADLFLVPAFVLGWMAAAVGFEQAFRLIEREAPKATWVLVAGMVSLPATQFARNIDGADRRHDTMAARYFEALFADLPDRSVLLREDFLVDRMVSYELVGERRAAGRDISGPVDADPATVERLAAAGTSVFAFPATAWGLRLQGFPFAPVVLPGPHWATYLTDLPSGFVVALACPARFSPEIDANGSSGLDAIGAGAQLVGRRPALSALGVRGARRGAIESLHAWHAEAGSQAGQEIGDTGVGAPATIRVVSDQETAAIYVDGREIVRTDAGLAIAVWNAAGEFVQAVVAPQATAFRAPIVQDGGFWPGLLLFRLTGPRACQALAGDQWTDVSTLARSGSVTIDAPGGTRIDLYAGGPTPIEPHVSDYGPSGELALSVEERGRADGAEPLTTTPPQVQGRVPAAASSAFLVRATLTAPGSPDGTIMTTVAFDGIPDVVSMKVAARETSAGPIAVCESRYEGYLRPDGDGTLSLGMSNNEQAMLLAGGWGPAQGEPWTPPIRRTVAPDARVLVPLGRADIATIRLEASPQTAADAGAATVGLQVNGVTLPAQILRAGWATYEWTVPPGLFVAGTNLLTVQTKHTAPRIEQGAGLLQVGSVTFVLSNAAASAHD